jgi:hypothetical protein
MGMRTPYGEIYVTACRRAAAAPRRWDLHPTDASVGADDRSPGVHLPAANGVVCVHNPEDGVSHDGVST